MPPGPLQNRVLSWKQAQELFESRLGYAAADYYQLEEWARAHGFTVTRVASYSMMLRVKDELQRIIETGGTLAEFESWAATAGVNWSRSYTELVYRQNVFGAYSQARFTELNDPTVARVFEILYYDAINDSRTRESHARMGGRSWKREDFPAGWWPQNGFNCRCEVRAVTQTMEQEAGLTRTRGNVRDRSGRNNLPDKGFQKNYLDRESQLRLLNNRLRVVRNNLGA